jgi:hypothetical protein
VKQTVSKRPAQQSIKRYSIRAYCVALSDRSRRLMRFASQLPAQLEARIVAIKRETLGVLRII